MIQIGLEISNASWSKFYAKFSASNPMPVVLEHESPDGQEIPEYDTELEWVNAWITNKLAEAEEAGREILKSKVASPYDDQIINRRET